ncbi:hypothetical protein [Apilactobacillus zhangqiuensis]|uniref:hypothetical protein n=1 Tax=Apilactobacillus zhangqiuensis TaxID=2841031 RepID=UPI001C7CE487|nr:hypothetical protein [Apilactobacillus zhangqiuensis]
MISAKKVFATFAVVLTLGGAVSSLTSVETSNVTAHASRKHVKKHVKKSSKDFLIHIGYAYNYSLNYFTGYEYLPSKNYSVNVPNVKKYEKTYHNYVQTNKYPTGYKTFAYKLKLLIAGMNATDYYVYGKNGFENDFGGKCQAVIMEGNTVISMQKTVVPLILNKIRRSDLKKLSKLRGNIMKYYFEKKTRKIYKYGGDEPSKSGYKSLRKVWDTSREYYQTLKKVFEYIK